MGNSDKDRIILAAAEELFTSRRFHEVTMDDVSRKAGVGKGTIYRYFKDKDELFSRLVLSGFSQLVDLIRSGAGTDGDFQTNLTHALIQTRGFFRRHKALFRMMHAEDGRTSFRRQALRAEWSERRQEVTVAIADIIRSGVASGRIRSDVSPECLAGMLLGMLRGFSSHADEKESPERTVPLLVELFLNGAAATQVPSRELP